MEKKLLYGAEYSKSKNSKCKVCKSGIKKDVLRLVYLQKVLFQSSYFGCAMMHCMTIKFSKTKIRIYYIFTFDLISHENTMVLNESFIIHVAFSKNIVPNHSLI